MKKPMPPAHRLHIVSNSSWGRFVIGSFKYVMDQRKVHLLKSMKFQVERDKANAKKGWNQSKKCMRWGCYGYVAMIVIAIIIP
jgi:hypothetical protein